MKKEEVKKFKRRYSWKLAWKLAMLALFVLLIVSILTGGFEDFSGTSTEFNPKKHICTKYDVYYPEDCIEIIGHKCITTHFLTTYNSPKVGDIEDCTEWRDKTYCERHPEDETRCVCEEYEYYFIFDETSTPSDIKIYTSDEIEDITFDVSKLLKKEKSCVKVREKTIRDLSCEELEDYLLNGNKCIDYNKRYHLNPCKQWEYPQGNYDYLSTKEEIFYLLNKEGCFQKNKEGKGEKL